MKRLRFILPLLLALRLHAADSVTPAEGFGVVARGGEGGRVIRVTSLADDGAGSLREALAQSGARIIEFAIEGAVELKSRLRIHVSEGGTSGDGILLWGKDGGVTRRVSVEQCSIHGATDEGVNTWGRVEDVTFQWCLIADAAPPHSKGWLSGAECDRITIHHCLFANYEDRNPKLEGGRYQVVNNVFVGWMNNNATKLRLGARVNLVGNSYLPGASSNASKGCVFIEDPPGELRLFMQGNVLHGQTLADEWKWVTFHERLADGWNEKRPAPEIYRARSPFEAPAVTTEKVSAALPSVLQHVGASPRDARDQRVIEKVRALE